MAFLILYDGKSSTTEFRPKYCRSNTIKEETESDDTQRELFLRRILPRNQMRQ